MLRRVAVLLTLLTLAACSSSPQRSAPDPVTPQASSGTSKRPGVGAAPSRTDAVRPGAYYKDDGPGENPPDFDRIADAQPRAERLHRFANNPYQVFGRDYVPLRVVAPFRQRGVASWYGRRYHGQNTSSGEVYNMYAMTAAHPTLPIPSYVRVTNPSNGRSVVVRINDRGPFHADRIIDLSFVAAYKLGYAQAGSTLVEVESLLPDAGEVAGARPALPTPAAKQVPAQPAAPLPLSSDAGGVYLQLGAFSLRDNAESFRAKIYKELPWLNDAVHVSALGNLYRLRLGPYRTQDDARRMAERIRAELNLTAVFLQR